MKSFFLVRSILFTYCRMWLTCSVEATAAQCLPSCCCDTVWLRARGGRMRGCVGSWTNLTLSSGPSSQERGGGGRALNRRPKTEARVRAEGGHPARSLSQRPACPQQPALINPLTGAAAHTGRSGGQPDHSPAAGRRSSRSDVSSGPASRRHCSRRVIILSIDQWLIKVLEAIRRDQ